MPLRLRKSRLPIMALACLLTSATCLPATAAEAEAVPGAPKKLLVVSTSTRNHFPLSIAAAVQVLAGFAAAGGPFTLDFVRQPSAPQPRTPQPPVVKPWATAQETAAFARATEEYKKAEAAYPEANRKFEAELRQSLQKLAPESLKNYDGVVFCYTTGDLPLPDPDGFIKWIQSGHAFIGIGNAMETLDSYPPYHDMLGASWSHFKGFQGWRNLEVVTANPDHPANAGLPPKWGLKEFSYKIPNFVLSDPAHTRQLMVLEKNPVDGTPGHFPLAWARDYGQGRVFYTALGGNLDLWNPDRPDRKNSPETARLFRSHLLGGIKWALNLDTAAPK